LDKSQKKLAKP